MRTQKATTLIKSSGGDGKKIGFFESKRNKKSSRDNLNEKSDFERNTETPTNEGRTFVTEQSKFFKKGRKAARAWWKKEFYLLPFISSGCCFFSAQERERKSARAPVLVKACFGRWKVSSLVSHSYSHSRGRKRERDRAWCARIFLRERRGAFLFRFLFSRKTTYQVG